jgi:hypothetical protein
MLTGDGRRVDLRLDADDLSALDAVKQIGRPPS